MNTNTNKNDKVFLLPEISIRKTLSIRFVNKAIAITTLILIITVIVAALVLILVKTKITIDAEGILAPSKIVRIHSPESGLIKKMLVRSGDTVNIKQVLIILDSLDLKKELFDVESQIALDKNSYSQKIKKHIYDEKQNALSLVDAEIQLIKAKASFRDQITNYFPRANFDSLYSHYKPGKSIAIDYAMSEVRSAETALKLSKLNIQTEGMSNYELTQLKIDLKKLYEQKRILNEKLKHVVIKSPIGGIVLTEGIEKLANNYVTEGTELLDIAKTNSWDAILFVDENDIHKVRMSNKVKIKLTPLQSANNYKLYDASIISIAAEKISAKDNYPNYIDLYRVSVKLTFDGDDKADLSKLKYEYKIDGEIITDSGRIIDLLIRYFRKLL